MPHARSEVTLANPTRRIVRCPACGGDSEFATSNPFRPFCCERCKQMDLGTWANEGFRFSGDPADNEYPTNPTDQIQ